MPPIPLDNLRTTGGPHPLMVHHMAKGVVQKTDTEGLADDPGVEVQYQGPAVLCYAALPDGLEVYNIPCYNCSYCSVC